MLRILSIRLLLLTLWVSSVPFTNSAETPNFIVIFIDDMGYGDIGPFGSTANRTPHLDQMAAEGMKFTDFYAAPVCSASRAQLMTGSYAPRVSIPGVLFPADSRGLNPEEMTIADYLKEAGYATMCIGKWHLGDQPEFLPTRQGFDSYFGIPYSNDMQRAAFGSQKKVTPLLRDEEVTELLTSEEQRRVTREYTEEAVRYIAEQSEEGQPFFLYFPHTAMHVPLYPHPDFVGTSKNGTYGDWIAEVDWSVGEVLTALKANGLDEDTLVIFTSDNGPWASKGKDAGSSGPLRGAKGGTMEGGVREPMIARWPGKIAPDSVSGTVAGTTDILPTLVSLAGGTVKSEIQIDGYDLTPVLLGEAADTERETWHYFQGKRLQAVRSGPWKLAVSSQSLGMGISVRPPELAKGGRLYNLDEDIGEKFNVAASHPAIVNRLEMIAKEMERDLGNSTRPAGSVKNPVTLYPTANRLRIPTKRSSSDSEMTTIDWEAAQPGDSFVAAMAPRIAGQALEIECQLEDDSASGVIVSHGGVQVGYTLYAKDGAVTLAVRHTTRIKRVSLPLTPEPQVIEAKIEADGRITLSTGEGIENSIETGRVFRSEPREDFCVGHDNGKQVDPQAPEGLFSGAFEGLKVTTGGNSET